MIPVETLERIRHVVVHGYADKLCPDGVASALIVRDAIPNAHIQFVTHGPQLEGLAVEPNMLFVDIAPPVGKVDAFLAAGAVVLDHHKSAKDLVALFEAKDLGDFADEKEDPGVSGATLAYRNVWRPLALRGAQRPPNHQTEGRGDDRIASFAKIVGVRDTYQRNSPNWQYARRLSAALAFWPFDRWPRELFREATFADEFQSMLDVGDILVEKADESIRSLWRTRYEDSTSTGKMPYVIVPSRETTDVAEMMTGDCGLLVGFSYEAGESPKHRPVLSLSLRSREVVDERVGLAGVAKRFDCSAFAKAHGGGGHSGAAGCRFEESSEPYAEIGRALEKHLRSGDPGIILERNVI